LRHVDDPTGIALNDSDTIKRLSGFRVQELSFDIRQNEIRVAL
jgi:hypothetical protein